ncbi:MAG: glycosyltransferase family 4 protein [Bacteroidota bacterium]
MRVLFVSHNALPEANAPASRLGAHAEEWVKHGEVEILTAPPNFPEGRVYEGYSNTFTQEQHGRLTMTRVPIFVAANSGVLRRFLSFISFMVSAVWYARRLTPPDIVVASSPQFFTALAGYRIAKRFGVPFVLEVRDLWPESIVVVGAMKRNAVIRFFERVERFLYRNADHIVSVTRGIETHVLQRGGVLDRATLITNGVNPQLVNPEVESAEIQQVRERTGLTDPAKFIVGYVGTIGMAHRVDIVYEAARLCPHPDIHFVVVGAGAGREQLEALVQAQPLDNFTLAGKLPRHDIPALLTLIDVSIVHLMDTPLFRGAIPSKMFEAMGTGTPLVVGLRGESEAIVEASAAGLLFQPESEMELLEQVVRLHSDPDLYAQLARNGPPFVAEHFDRTTLAHEYWDLLANVVSLGEPSSRY